MLILQEMENIRSLVDRVINIQNKTEFAALAMEVFRLQAEHNAVYRHYMHVLGIKPEAVLSMDEIPFLPIQFFKSQQVLTHLDKDKVEAVFRSSTTTGSVPSEHPVLSLALYDKSLMAGFQLFYGDPREYCFLALLPSYIERSDSSLVYMVKELMAASAHPNNGFFLNDLASLAERLLHNEQAGQKTLLIGVSFALLDFAEQHPMPLKHTQIMETGGMKGRRKELLREELHELLGKAFEMDVIGSEYGMTELLSQAYALKQGAFACPPSMQVLVRDTQDPFTYLANGKSGGLNIIDLANLYSCSFIETQDLGRINPNGSFSVLGRFDHSDIRGCNLMAQL